MIAQIPTDTMIIQINLRVQSDIVRMRRTNKYGSFQDSNDLEKNFMQGTLVRGEKNLGGERE